MAEARARHEWAQTALVACTLWNIPPRLFGGPQKGPEEFTPYQEEKAYEEPDIRLSGKEGMALLKRILGGRHG